MNGKKTSEANRPEKPIKNTHRGTNEKLSVGCRGHGWWKWICIRKDVRAFIWCHLKASGWRKPARVPRYWWCGVSGQDRWQPLPLQEMYSHTKNFSTASVKRRDGDKRDIIQDEDVTKQNKNGPTALWQTAHVSGSCSVWKTSKLLEKLQRHFPYNVFKIRLVYSTLSKTITYSPNN